jgi:vacuolar-type H+-ATPase subunit E/Vma4
MEEIVSKIKTNIDAILADANGKAEEVKENFENFKTVFGKELEVQTENLKVYKEKIEAKGKQLFASQDVVNDLRNELESVVKEVKSNADKVFDFVKETISKAK